MTCRSGYDDGLLRAYLDRELPARQEDDIGRHLAECPECSRTLSDLEATRDAVATSLRLLEPDPTRIPSATTAYARLTASHPQPTPAPSLIDRLGAWLVAAPRALPTAALAAIALVAALAFTPLGLAAQDFFAVFRAQNIQTIKVSTDTLKQVPDPSDLGTFEPTGEPEFGIVTAPEAAREAGFAVPSPKALPADFATKSVVTYWKPLTATYTYDAAKVAAYWKEKGLAGDTPAELAGLVVRIQVPATVVQVYGDSQTVESVGAAIANQGSGQPGPTPVTERPRILVIAQNRGPQIEVPAGTDVAKLRKELLERGALPPELATQLATISDWQSTVPVPIVNGESREVTVSGAKGVLVVPKTSDRAQTPFAGVIWQKGGVWYWAFGSVTEAELLAAVNSLG